MWTDTTRAQYARAQLTLPSDLTDSEWAVLEPCFPPPSHVGRPRKWPLRRIVEAILYLLRGGLPWRMLPPCFPPVSTVRRWFYLWRDNGLWLSLNHALLLIGREAAGREASPSTGVVNRRSIGTPYRRAKRTPLPLCGLVDAGRMFRAAGGVGRA
jgi:transposase